MPQIPSDQMLAALQRDPCVYPHQFDIVTQRVLLASLPEAALASAVFLDQRVLQPDTPTAVCAWEEFEKAASAFPPNAPAYIFHIGHSGSTLLSRLVASAAGAPPLREPLPLRAFAADEANALDGAAFLSNEERRRRLALFERLWARRKGTVLKATSICNNLIDRVSPDAPVAFIFIRPAAYLTLMLGGANTIVDLRSFAQLRLRRLKAAWPEVGDLSRFSPGELAAMSWLAETCAAAAAERSFHGVDFDAFLEEPESALSRLCDALGRPADEAKLRGAVRGPLMQQYSKAPDHAYSPSVRRQIMSEDRTLHAAEIKAGLLWLDRAASSFSLGEKALGRFG